MGNLLTDTIVKRCKRNRAVAENRQKKNSRTNQKRERDVTSLSTERREQGRKNAGEDALAGNGCMERAIELPGGGALAIDGQKNPESSQTGSSKGVNGGGGGPGTSKFQGASRG